MKKMNLKNLFLVGMITASCVGTQTYAREKDKETPKNTNAIENNRLANRKEYKDMKATISRIEKDRERIVFHKEELKKNKEADLKIESHMCKKEIRKAKADLKRDKKYLRIDQADLASDQWVAIQQANKEKRTAKKELRHAKCAVRKDLRKGDAAALKTDAARVQALYQIKEREKEENLALKEEVFEFFALLDEKIAEVV